MHFLESLSNALARCERLYTAIRSGIVESCRGLRLLRRPILVAARSNAFVCDRSLPAIGSSNPVGVMDVSLL
jgi:hypothetical protein